MIKVTRIGFIPLREQGNFRFSFLEKKKKLVVASNFENCFYMHITCGNLQLK